MPKIRILPTATADPLAVALGYAAWNFNPTSSSASAATASQTIYAMGIWLPPGITVTGVVLPVITAAAGTKPTAFYAGLCTATKMVAQSADVSGASGVPFAAAGLNQIAFSSTYTTNPTDSATGLYYVCVLQNGSWGTTQPAFERGSTGVVLGALTGKNPLIGSLGTGQATFASNGSAVTVGSAAAIAFCVGVY